MMRPEVLKMLCKYSPIVFILLTAATSAPKSTNCQTQTRHNLHDTATGSNCNQQQQQQARQQRQFNHRTLAGHLHLQQQHLHQQQHRQQEYLDRLSAAVVAPTAPSADASPEQEEFSLAPGIANGRQQATSGNYTLLPQLAAPGSSNEQSAGNGANNISSPPAMPTAPASNKNTDSTPTSTAATIMSSTTSSSSNSNGGASSTTPTVPSDSINPSVVLQPPATTTSAIQLQSSGTTSRAAASVAPPLNQAPAEAQPALSTAGPITGAPLTSSKAPSIAQSSPSAAAPDPLVASAGNKLASARRVDDQRQQAASPTGSSNSNKPAGPEPAYQRRHEQLFSGQQQQAGAAVTATVTPTTSSAPASSRHSSGTEPVSSLPSSISIITPLLMGPPDQQTHSTATVGASVGGGASADSKSLMKPLFVVGSPISEYDYNTGLYDSQYQRPAGSSELPPTLLAKGLGESSSAAAAADQQQLDAVGGSSPTQQKAAAPKSVDQPDTSSDSNVSSSFGYSNQQQQNLAAIPDRMGGPPLAYSVQQPIAEQQPAESPPPPSSLSSSPSSGSGGQQQPQLSPRLFQGQQGAAVLGNNPRRPSLPPPVNQANAASGFRSPMSPSGPLVGGGQTATTQQQLSNTQLSAPINSLPPGATANFYQTSPPYAGAGAIGMPVGAMSSLHNNQQQQQAATHGKQAFVFSSSQQQLVGNQQPQQQQQVVAVAQPQVPTPSPGTAPGSSSGRRPLNITRVEHISAECSNDLIRAVIVFNGTFKGIIYSSGYVNDPTCLYVNGTGSTRYEFSIRLNQCGTLGRQELHQPTIPGEARRRDQVMWNTLSIQYNSIIEQEWDEHFRVSCEYGSDFWKTVSFSPFNVETNTGSPVVFTINPPQCQMDVLLGHGMGPKIVDGPVTVGDPLTLLIHMKSEKAGYDILVKNCVAHNGGKQRMQLIDSNGCVVNERFISPFRGTYNDNDLRHVTLYAYLKAFRFTGSPVLYLECEIHMCQSACPPQMCYWRRLSKRSVDEFDYEYTTNSSSIGGPKANSNDDQQQPIISDSLNLFKALQVRQESEPTKSRSSSGREELRQVYAEDEEAALICYRHAEVILFLTAMGSLLTLVIVIAFTCCWRIRKLTRSPFGHSKLPFSGSLSPSLLSISDVLSSAGSIITTKEASAMPACHYQHQHQHHHHQQRLVGSPNKALKLMQTRQTVPPPISSFRANNASNECLSSHR